MAYNGMIGWRGWRACACIAAIVPLVESRARGIGILGPNATLRIFQAGYNAGGVAASAGTHDGGGVLDTDHYSDAWVRIFRECGFFYWHRTRAQGFDPHGHGGLYGCPHMSAGLIYQGSELRYNRRNGLAGRGADDGPRVPFITWQDALEKYGDSSLDPIIIPQEGPLDMTKAYVFDRKKDTPLTRGKWATLPINDAGDQSILTGDVDGVVTLNVDISGLKPGEVVQLRPITVDYKSGAKTTTRWTGPGEEIVGNAGATYGQSVWVGHIGKSPNKGYARRLRFQAITTGTGVKLTRTVTRTIHG